MKTILRIKMLLLVVATSIVLSCGTQHRGSAADNTGTNGATNGTGKVPKSEGVHNYQN